VLLPRALTLFADDLDLPADTGPSSTDIQEA
jgi:hypothetical protein